MTDKEKIKAEIEKRIEILSGTHAGRSSDVIIALEEIVSFIDSMQETEFKETEVLKRKLSNIAKAIYEHKGPENPTVEHIREIVQDCCFELMDLEKEYVDYDKLDTILDEALSKETKESWNKRLGEEPVSEEWIEELRTKLDSMSKEDFKKVFDKYTIDFNEEPVSEDLKTELNKYIKGHFTIDTEQLDRFGIEEKDYMYSMDKSDMLALVEHFTNWLKAHLWKPADGDDLPEYDKEVIAILDYDFGHYKVVYAHRPNPNGWDGTNIDTGEKEHFEPEIYDKGGWNQPHVLYWLDTILPYEENKIIKEL